ncbi:hypothetical protein, partial [Streptomyces bambusae]
MAARAGRPPPCAAAAAESALLHVSSPRDAATIATQRRLSTYANARLFALVSIAMADAGIAVRDV